MPEVHFRALDTFRSIDLDETPVNIQGPQAQLFGWHLTNTATSTRYVKFYDSTDPVVGTTEPKLTIPIAGNSSDDVSANLLAPNGLFFDNGLSVAATTGLADNDTGAPGANEVIVNIFYR